MKIGKRWGMYTSLGNLRLKTSAEQLVRDLAKAKDTVDKLQAVKKYFLRYQRLTYKKGFQEAGDTAVREEIVAFALEALPEMRDAITQVWREALNEEWENYKNRKSAAIVPTAVK